jgi:predicted nucleic-acid-binding protein
MTVLIDTNVVLDYILEREQFVESACECLERLTVKKAKMFLTASTITDIYYLTLKQVKDNNAAKEVISKLLDAFGIVPVDRNDCVNALKIGVCDYEDALVSVCAKKIKASYIITRNTKHFSESPVKALAPLDFISLN